MSQSWRSKTRSAGGTLFQLSLLEPGTKKALQKGHLSLSSSGQKAQLQATDMHCDAGLMHQTLPSGLVLSMTLYSSFRIHNADVRIGTTRQWLCLPMLQTRRLASGQPSLIGS